MNNDLSRRAFLALIGVVTVEVATPQDASARPLGRVGAQALNTTADPATTAPSAQADILSATLSWQDPAGDAAWKGQAVQIFISKNKDLKNPLVHTTVPADTPSYRFAVAPVSTYYWRIVPVADGKPQSARAADGSFTTAAPNRDPNDEDDKVRYAGARGVARGGFVPPVPISNPPEPLSPWYAKKKYDGIKPPTFDEVKDKFPVPILDAEPGVLDAYWYSWKTLMTVWLFPPDTTPHQAVSNLIGIADWAGVGATMVWDTAFILQFARYGHHAYPFITGFDNTYARQHENGFICRESDPINVERYVEFPVNPPLFAWAEWQSYLLTGDQERIATVFTPIVKHYEWWVRFQRRQNGLYWTGGFNEADDSPRNQLMYYAASANSYQALAAMLLGRMAKVVNRPDLVDYFESEHAALGKMVNARFWDEKHQIYNDLTQDEQFITELHPGSLCKHGHMFWPMLAEVAPPDRVQGLVRELKNPKSFFRASGVPSLSADSEGYNPPTGWYWKGAVWPPIQCLVQSGLKVCGEWEFAQQLAQKYLTAVVTAYQKQHTITENLYPDEPVGQGHDNFVGWGGIGPIQDLIEYTLGFDVSAPTNTITWRITRTDRHGIEKLAMGKSTYDLVCAPRSSATEPCHIAVKTTNPFTLKVITNGKEHVKKIERGEQTLVIA